MKIINTPIKDEIIKSLKVGDTIEISGYIYTGRDAVLPKIAKLIREDKIGETGIELKGRIIFHTAVSPAGVGPTSSNKIDIQNSMQDLSKAGIKIHLGKGSLSKETVSVLNKYNSVYAVIPPVTALLSSKIKNISVISYAEEGMEALHLLEVENFPAIVAVAHGESIF